MKRLFSQISFHKKGLLMALLFVGIFFTLYHKNSIQAFFNDPGEGAFFGGLTGAGFGYAVGGKTGAIAGGIAGAGLGAAAGAARSDNYDATYRLDKLYSKRERLERRIRETKSDSRRARYQRQLDEVNAEIAQYEAPRYEEPRYHR